MSRYDDLRERLIELRKARDDLYDKIADGEGGYLDQRRLEDLEDEIEQLERKVRAADRQERAEPSGRWKRTPRGGWSYR